MNRSDVVSGADRLARHGLVPWERPLLALGEELDMRIDPRDLQSVVFLCEDHKPDAPDSDVMRRPIATAFFVRVKSEGDPNVSWDYIVTARHAIRDDRGSDTLWVRVNRKDRQQAQDFETERRQWRVHPEADVAAILSTVPLPDSTNALAYRSISIGDFVGPGPDYGYEGGGAGSTGTKAQVGLGDDVFALGLFAEDAGVTLNLPVARFGRISRMPNLVNVAIGHEGGRAEKRDVVAYLAEFLSWPGLSGSPVFWSYPMHPKLLPEQRGFFTALLGLVTGHHHHREKLVNPAGERVTDEELRKLRAKLNTGIAIVTPSEAIRELLMSQLL